MYNAGKKGKPETGGKIMDWKDAIALLHGADWKHTKIGLERMRAFMKLLGDPQDQLRFIHIAGTNGKGSSCAMTRSILSAAGFRTGLYISPHLSEFNERISIDGQEIPDEALLRLAARIRTAARKLGEEPTDFELITALAFCWFSEQHCDFVVLEVGMGGRLDATNVIRTPEVCAVMHIGLDHTEFLGDTVEKVAAEKAGILKPGADVVLYHQLPSVMAVVRQHFQNVNTAAPDASLVVTDPAKMAVRSAEAASPLGGSHFDYRARRDLCIRLLGKYQIENAMAVLDIMDCLRKRGYDIPEDAIRRGLQTACWPGRFELLSEDPVLIVDGAHNPNGAEALADSLRFCFPDQKIRFVMGVMKDKDYPAMLRIMAPLAECFITELPDSTRALDPSALKAEIQSCFAGPVETAVSVTEAVQRAMTLAKQHGGITVCFGSLYQVAEIRRFFRSDAGGPEETRSEAAASGCMD